MAFSRTGIAWSSPLLAKPTKNYSFVEKLPDRYTCLVCHDVQQEPTLVSCCGQHFCQSCLQQWFSQSGQRCPHCQLTGISFVVNKQQARDINDLKVYCTNNSKGCVWVGTVGTLEKHIGETNTELHNSGGKVQTTGNLDHGYQPGSMFSNSPGQLSSFSQTGFSFSPKKFAQPPTVPKPLKRTSTVKEQCEYQEISCPNNCKKTLTRGALPSHLSQNCLCRAYSCEHCGLRGTYHAITGECGGSGPCALHKDGHYSKCQSFPVECPNQCSQTVKRMDLAAHRETCPLEPVECPFSEVGCTEKMARRDMEDHVSSSDHHHLLLTMRAFVQSKKEIEELKANMTLHSQVMPPSKPIALGYKSALTHLLMYGKLSNRCCFDK